MDRSWLKTILALGILVSSGASLGYDPLAGVRGDVSKILDPETTDAELDAITDKHRRWTGVHQGQVTSDEMRNAVTADDRQRIDRNSGAQYGRDADVWDARERAERDAGNTWEAETARGQADYSRGKAREYGWR